MKRYDKGGSSGFTLMEMVVALIVSGIVAALTFKILYNQVDAFNTIFSNTLAVSDLRKVVRVLRKDIRNMDRSTLSTMESAELEFKRNDEKNIHYLYENGHLYKNDSTLIGNLTQEPFSFLDYRKDETGSADSLSFVQVTLQMLATNGDHVRVEETIYARN